MNCPQPVYDEFIDVPFQNNTLRVQLQITPNYNVLTAFTFNNRPYSFLVTRWSGHGLAQFLPLALQCRPDPALPIANDGTIPPLTQQQRLATIIQATRDVFSTIDAILEKHGRGILGYAAWYHENSTHADRTAGLEDTYEAYITLVACIAIVHMDFMAPDVHWAVVHFRP